MSEEHNIYLLLISRHTITHPKSDPKFWEVTPVLTMCVYMYKLMLYEDDSHTMTTDKYFIVIRRFLVCVYMQRQRKRVV